MAQEDISISKIQSAISKAGVEWEAEETRFTTMSGEDRARLLGYTPGPGDAALEEAEAAAKANYQSFRAMEEDAVGYPNSYDLRNLGGNNYVAGIGEQAGCGSCVAFGVAAAAEGRLRRQLNNPNHSVDYSEAHLFHCYAYNQGRRCGPPHPQSSWGWWPSNALDIFRDEGVVDEACYPYTGADQACTNLCSDWNSRLTKISDWHRITSTDEMKEWISTKGPLVACYTVYTDFFSYTKGIYKYVSGNIEGGHCVAVVGYNDAQEYWICKNSWGSTFGLTGFFLIGYGEVGIDDSMDAVHSVANVWAKDKRIDGLWTINEDRNAWAHVTGLGWKKVNRDNDNIFFDMLAQLVAAKAGNRRVDLRLENDLIKELYVF